jgi:hypothetical protein
MQESTSIWLGPSVAASGVLISAAVGFVIAIYGDDIRAFCRKPKLCISIPDPEGEWTVITDNTTRKIIDNAIYFHVLLENEKPTRIARDVELYILECVVSDTQRNNVKMPLPCPLPIQARREFKGQRHDRIDVGGALFAYDLIRCLRSGRIEVLLNCNRPNNFAAWIQGKGSMSLWLEARGVNAASNRLFVNIQWDGVFPEENAGLGSHITITVKTN